MASDVVCGMEVDEATATLTSEYEGTTYYFCAPGCKKAFEDDPKKYLASDEGHESHQDHDHMEHHNA